MTATFPGGTPTQAQLRGDLSDNVSTLLSAGINDSVTTIPVDDTTGFPSAGLASIKAANGSGLIEVFSYTGLTANSFTGVTRNFNGKGAQAYSEDDEVHLYWVADHHNRHVEETVAIGANLIARFGTGTNISVPNGIGKEFVGQTFLKSPSIGVNSVLGIKDANGSTVWQLEYTDASGNLRIYPAGSYKLQVDASQSIFSAGTPSLPGVAVGDANIGLWKQAANSLGLISGGTLMVYFPSTTGMIMQTGVIQNNAGTQSLPSYSFWQDPSSGIRLFGSGDVRFVAAAVDHFRISGNGIEMLNNKTIEILNGSDSNPGLAFAIEPSTGLYRPGSNILGLAANEVYINRANSGGTNYLEVRNTSSTSPSYAQVTARHNNGTYEANMNISAWMAAGGTERMGALGFLGHTLIEAAGTGGVNEMSWTMKGVNAGTPYTAITCTNDGMINKPQNPSFYAWKDGDDFNVTGDGTEWTVLFDSEKHDNNSNFTVDAGGGDAYFTAPITGRYLFNWYVGCQPNSFGGTTILCWLNGGGYNTYAAGNDAVSSTQTAFNGSAVRYLTAGQQVRIILTGYAGSKVINAGGGNATNTGTFFSGELLS